MPHFFATADDLLAIFAAIESRRAIAYTRTGIMRLDEIATFATGENLATLRMPVSTDTASMAPAYMITDTNRPVVPRPIFVLGEAEPRWAIDQLINPDSTVLSHGGFFGADVLLCGRVASASQSVLAKSLQRAFESQIRRQFCRIKAFYVGEQAARLLDGGVRLTMSAQSPREFNLTR